MHITRLLAPPHLRVAAEPLENAMGTADASVSARGAAQPSDGDRQAQAQQRFELSAQHGSQQQQHFLTHGSHPVSHWKSQQLEPLCPPAFDESSQEASQLATEQCTFPSAPPQPCLSEPLHHQHVQFTAAAHVQGLSCQLMSCDFQLGFGGSVCSRAHGEATSLDWPNTPFIAQAATTDVDSDTFVGQTFPRNTGATGLPVGRSPAVTSMQGEHPFVANHDRFPSQMSFTSPAEGSVGPIPSCSQQSFDTMGTCTTPFGMQSRDELAEYPPHTTSLWPIALHQFNVDESMESDGNPHMTSLNSSIDCAPDNDGTLDETDPKLGLFRQMACLDVDDLPSTQSPKSGQNIPHHDMTHCAPKDTSATIRMDRDPLTMSDLYGVADNGVAFIHPKPVSQKVTVEGALPATLLRCPHPTCSVKTLFTRQCDLRKHYQLHTRKYFCRVPTGDEESASFQQSSQACSTGFAMAKDRDRHERAHNPSLPCHFCGKLFSRFDNMREHIKKQHAEELRK